LPSKFESSVSITSTRTLVNSSPLVRTFSSIARICSQQCRTKTPMAVSQYARPRVCRTASSPSQQHAPRLCQADRCHSCRTTESRTPPLVPESMTESARRRRAVDSVNNKVRGGSATQPRTLPAYRRKRRMSSFDTLDMTATSLATHSLNTASNALSTEASVARGHTSADHHTRHLCSYPPALARLTVRQLKR
jgi:hypothetical protein